jgi:hypothetical protein
VRGAGAASCGRAGGGPMSGHGGARSAVEGGRMRSWVQVMWSPLLALVVLLSLGPLGEPGAALVGGAGIGAAAAPLDQTATPPLCASPRRAGDVPERSAEMRLVRDADGVLWQIQSGCRHLVQPYYMDAATLNAIPLGENASFVTYGFPAPVPTPSGLSLPSYARLPVGNLSGQPPLEAAPAPEASAPPGTLDRYQSRVLVIDPGNPNAVYLLQGGLRHRVLVYYPTDVALADVDPSRAGDLASYALRGPNGFVATIGEVPWGEPAPRVGWGTGESIITSDRVVAPDAVNCAGMGVPGTPSTGLPTLRAPGAPDAPASGASGRSRLVCQRFRAARTVSVDAYVANPGLYAGTDLQLRGGVACSVRYVPARDGKSLAYVAGDASVPAFAYGAEAQRDPLLASRQTMNIGAFIQSVTETGAQATSGELTVFAYEPTGPGPCPSQGGR